MNLWKKLFRHKKNIPEETPKEGWEEDTVLKREDVNLKDPQEREKYVRSCLEQIAEASKETEELTSEYGLVTSYLTDMEEVEALPLEEKQEIAKKAEKVVQYLGEQQRYQRKASKMSDNDYKKMERLQDDMPAGYDKLRESEAYHELIRGDLVKLSGERHAYYYRRNELKVLLENTRGIALITLIAMSAACIILLILQLSLDMQVRMGYLMAAGLGAIVLTLLFVKYADGTRELKRVELSINKIILLQNRVKIRYVNNSNLLDYYCMKYQVDSAAQLKELWELFLVEREEREKMEKANEELDFYSDGLVSLLSGYHIKDPHIWIRQADALLDEREMVEIRHNLIGRRQKLRKQMDYNRQIADTAQQEIKDLVKSYPQYAKEILDLVSEY